MIKTIRLSFFGILATLAMSSCSKEETPQARNFTVEFAVDGGNGSISPSGKITHEEGKEVTALATPEGKFYFNGWYESEKPNDKLNSGGDITVNDEKGILKVRLTEATSGKKYMAKFAETLYTVNFLASGEGTVNPETGSVSAGNKLSSIAEPKPGSKLVGWFDPDGKQIVATETSANIYISKNGKQLNVKASEGVDKNIFTAKFAEVLYTVNFSASGEGSVNPTTNSAAVGKPIVSMAEPKPGYTLVGWFDSKEKKIETSDTLATVFVSEGGKQLNVISSLDENEKSYTAKFEKFHTVYFLAGDNGEVTSKSVSAVEGQYASSIAKPKEGYGIAGWYNPDLTIIVETDTLANIYLSENGNQLNVKASTAVDQKTFTAKFAPYHTAFFKAEEGGSITSTSDSAPEGFYISSMAVETEYEFEGWYNEDDSKIIEGSPTANIFVSEGGKKLNIKSVPGMTDKTYTAKFYVDGSRIYVSGTGDSAKLLLTKNPKRSGTMFQFGSIMAFSSNEGPAVVDFNPSMFENKWYSSWWVGPTFPTHTIGNLKTAKGDPCKLIGFTQKEIKDALRSSTLLENKKWRLPTIEENAAFANMGRSQLTELEGIKGFYIGPDATESGTGGVFFPAAGYRMDAEAIESANDGTMFWSMTSYDSVNGFSTSLYKPNFLDANRVTEQYYATSVRCVKQ
ncbi:MAG: InlB B-repeat-containing protein [Phocaeicola sp.]